MYLPSSHPLNCIIPNERCAPGSLVAQAVKNPPVMQEIQVQILGREDPLGKGTVNHSSILAWRIPDRGAWWAIVRGVAKSWT